MLVSCSSILFLSIPILTCSSNNLPHNSTEPFVHYSDKDLHRDKSQIGADTAAPPPSPCSLSKNRMYAINSITSQSHTGTGTVTYNASALENSSSMVSEKVGISINSQHNRYKSKKQQNIISHRTQHVAVEIDNDIAGQKWISEIQGHHVGYFVCGSLILALAIIMILIYNGVIPMNDD